jgi:hypothetical protein
MKQDLIFSRNADNSPLTLEQIQKRAPAAFTNEKHPERAERYKHINTSQAIDILADYGYQVTQAAQVRSRTEEANKYAHHMLALSNPEQRAIDEGTPEIILYNSGDGKSSWRMFAGFYRFICSNGIIAGNGFEIRARHYQTTASRFEQMIKEAGQRLPDMLSDVERLKDIRLDHIQELGLASQAARIRWNHLDDVLKENGGKPWPNGTYASAATSWNLVRARRPEDLEPNAWTAFNRIQEGLIRGGVEVYGVSDRNPAGKPRKAKPIGSVKEGLRVNRQLWDLFNLDKLEEVAA